MFLFPVNWSGWQDSNLQGRLRRPVPSRGGYQVTSLHPDLVGFTPTRSDIAAEYSKIGSL